MLLGEDLLAYLVLALGGAMAVGSLFALVRPPELRGDGPRIGRPRQDQMMAERYGCGTWVNKIKRREHGVKRPPTGGLFL